MSPTPSGSVRPRLYVDFSETVGEGIVALSARDTVLTDTGAVIELAEGLAVALYSFDIDENGQPDHLVANGVVERNASERAGHVKWVCRIDAAGIRHEADLAP